MFKKIRLSQSKRRPNDVSSYQMRSSMGKQSIQMSNINLADYEEQKDEEIQDVKKEDDQVLAKKDEKVVMAKTISSFMSLAFCFAAIGATASVIGYFEFQVKTGGPAVIVWGWIGVSFILMITAYCFAEIVSAFPFAGSVYVWTGKLSNKDYAPIASYFCGNFILIGALANVAAYIISNAQILNYMIRVLYGYNMSNLELSGIALFICLTQCALNRMRVEYIGYMNEFIAVYITFASLVVYVFFFFTTKKLSSNEFVFFTFNNQSNIPCDYYVAIVGLMVPILGQMGFDAAGQLGEETPNAEVVAPRAIIGGLLVTQLSGLGFIIGMLYAMCLQDGSQIEQFLSKQNRNDNLVIHIFDTLIDGEGKTIILIVASMIIFFLLYTSDVSQITYTQRTTYALARDQALPYSDFFSKLDDETQTPNNTLYLVIFVQILFLILYNLSQDAFNAIGGISTVGYLIAYIFTQLAYVCNPEIDFSQNKFCLGKKSRFLNTVSVIFLSLFTLTLFFPQLLNQKEQVTISNFNWNIIVTIVFTIFLTIRWHLYMKSFFKGPCEKQY